MIPIWSVATVTSLYIIMLFCVAYYADKRREEGRSLISNSYIYSLSLAVYFTSWTFYGSVGRAATSGLDFLPIYLGPTLIAFTWWFVLRKMVRISKEQNIVSIADFISSRYGKSALLGAVVTIFAVLGIMPYIALQLKAVAYTFDLLTAHTEHEAGILFGLGPWLPDFVDTAFIIALLLGAFGVLFGARHLDASERHEGLVAAVAVESLVKLVAFIAVGLFVTYGLFDGFTDIFTRFRQAFPERSGLTMVNTAQAPYSMWFTLTFISMMAVMFLPRQFHIMVIENSDEEHIRKAMWRFPAYMFLLNLFVVPVALAGLLLNGGETAGADYFLLSIPLESGHLWLALIVFVGGFSASAGMVMVESVALATMILNHLVMPLLLEFALKGKDLSRLLINIKRLAIMAVVLLGYVFYRMIGDSYALVNIGLISFIAASQFAPAMLGALYWKRANRRGALAGLILGFVVWFYTLLVPSFARSGWFDAQILEQGPFGLHLLRPLELFGLSGFDMWTHSLFWSLFFNIGAFLVFSLMSSASRREKEQAVKFVDVFEPPREQATRTRISKAPTIIEFVELMGKFIGEKQASLAISEYLGNREIDAKGSLHEYEIPGLKRFTERTLAGSVGAAPARIIIENYLSARGSRMEDVFDIFGSVTLSRSNSREQLSVLYEAARAVSSGAPLQTILDNILDLLHQQFKFDLCVIRFLDESKQALVVRSQNGMSSAHLGESERNLSTDTYIGAAFLTNATTVVNDTDFMDKPASSAIVHREGITSFAHAPITLEGEPVGILSAFSRSAKGIFTAEFVELFTSLARQIGIAWRNARQTDELIEAREQEKELAIAKQIQTGLLPDRTPDVLGITLAGICVPARQVGGDYYDYLALDREHLDLIIADVSGHNTGAALLMAEARTFIQATVRNHGNVAGIMKGINHFLYSDLSRAELFITMFYARYDATSGILTYASAGHNPPLLWRQKPGTCERLDAEGLILGIQPQVEFEERQILLASGDVLLLYTDGVTEAEEPAGGFFGEERLSLLLQEHRRQEPEQLIATILHQLRIFTGNQSFRDDVSMVVMKISGEPAAGGRPLMASSLGKSVLDSGQR